MPSKIEGLADLIRKAKDDPKFFHSLIWDTEKAVSSVDFLSREEKAEIMRINPEDLVVGLATGRFNSGPSVDRYSSCGGSCGVSCGASCGISCGVSCASSCGASSLITDPSTQTSIPSVDLTGRIQNELVAQRFSSFTR